MEVYLIRHTETILSEGVCYGQTDVHVKQPYLTQFDSIVKSIESQSVKIYSSPLTRCTRLVHHFRMYKEEIRFVKSDNRLKEMNFGAWEMKKWDEIDQGELNKWMADFINVKTPKGECFLDLHSRVKQFFDEEIISSNNENETIVIITHAGVI